MSVNLYKRLLELIPHDILLVGEVTAHNADGTSTVELPDGSLIRARGQTVAVGDKAFVEAGQIQGDAPDLPAYDVEIF